MSVLEKNHRRRAKEDIWKKRSRYSGWGGCWFHPFIYFSQQSGAVYRKYAQTFRRVSSVGGTCEKGAGSAENQG